MVEAVFPSVRSSPTLNTFGTSTLLDETVNGVAQRRRWCGTGGIVNHDGTGSGEARVVKTRMFDRLRASVE